MPAETSPTSDRGRVRRDEFPERLDSGSSVLVACAGAVTRHAVPLSVIARFAHSDDSALVVTATESATQTFGRFERYWPHASAPALAVVDTVSREQYLTAIYDERPVVYTPGPGDLERLVLALSEISTAGAPTDADRHLVVRSLTPLLDATSTARVARILDRIVGLRSADGCSVFGIDYTAHDRETMATMAECVEGILWVTETSTGDLDFEYRSTRQGKGRSTGRDRPVD